MGLETDFHARLQTYQVVGFDTMVFIYQFEDHPTFAPLTQQLFEAVERGQVSAHISVLVAGEVLTGPKKAGNQEILLLYRHILSNYPNLVLDPVTMQVMECMSDLRARYNLKTPDAIHVATALLHGAQAFVTNDERLRQVEAEGLDILVLSDFSGMG
jgi:predicted nucleic acid-binding protein